jgi:hypothetical protein
MSNLALWPGQGKTADWRFQFHHQSEQRSQELNLRLGEALEMSFQHKIETKFLEQFE